MKLAVGLAWLVCGCADDGGPRLDHAAPSSASRDAFVDIAGHRLCADHPACMGVTAIVELGLSPPMVQAPIMSYADDLVRIQIPSVAEIGSTDIILTVDGTSSNALPFEVLP